jgi:hypothetical protein
MSCPVLDSEYYAKIAREGVHFLDDEIPFAGGVYPDPQSIGTLLREESYDDWYGRKLGDKSNGIHCPFSVSAQNTMTPSVEHINLSFAVQSAECFCV